MYISVSLAMYNVYLCISHKRKSQQKPNRNYFYYICICISIWKYRYLCISVSLYIKLYPYSPYLCSDLYISVLSILCQLRFIWNTVPTFRKLGPVYIETERR